MIHVSILGATGYSGGELLRLLANRPGVKLQHLTSESSAGKPVSAIHPDLLGRLNRSFESLNLTKITSDSDVVFSCYPHGIGIKPISTLYSKGVKVIDLSGDFRLPSKAMYKTWYKLNHTASPLLSKAVYGLPELFRNKIKEASLIANPGCYATAAILSGYPLLKNNIVDASSLIVDAKSGVSGAGKKLASSYLYCEVNENLKAYSVGVHRHQPEIETVLARSGSKNVRVLFTPHLIPMNRGIFSVLYANLKKKMTEKDVRTAFHEIYADQPFVRVLPEGQVPETKNVTYTNTCDIAVKVDVRSQRVIVLAVLDNLVKGAAGQAVQNMNLLFNRPETEGL